MKGQPLSICYISTISSKFHHLDHKILIEELRQPYFGVLKALLVSRGGNACSSRSTQKEKSYHNLLSFSGFMGLAATLCSVGSQLH